MSPNSVKSKPHIAFVANVGYSLFRENTKDTYGGGQIDLYLLAQELEKTGNYSVTILFLDYGQPAEEFVDGIRLIKTYVPRNSRMVLWQFLAACWRLWKALYRANADIYLHEGASFEIAVTRIYCFIMKRKYIFRAAIMGDVNGQYQKQYPLHGFFYSFGLSGAHAIIAQTNDQQQYLQHKKGFVGIIENMYPITSSPPSKRKLTLWVGRLVKVKRPEIFLQLAKRYPEEQFLMLGPIETIDQEYARGIQVQARSIKNVQYVEQIPFQKTPALFHQAKLLVSTSIHEGFPMTFVQAMCDGVPILSLGVDPDRVVSSVAGLVARDLDDCCTKYEQLQQLPIWNTTAKASLTYAKQHFAPEVVVPKYDAVFRNILVQ